LRALANQGLAIIFVSSDNQEVLGLADTVATFFPRAAVRVTGTDQCKPEDLLRDVTHPDLARPEAPRSSLRIVRRSRPDRCGGEIDPRLRRGGDWWRPRASRPRSSWLAIVGGAITPSFLTFDNLNGGNPAGLRDRDHRARMSTSRSPAISSPVGRELAILTACIFAG